MNLLVILYIFLFISIVILISSLITNNLIFLETNSTLQITGRIYKDIRSRIITNVGSKFIDLLFPPFNNIIDILPYNYSNKNKKIVKNDGLTLSSETTMESINSNDSYFNKSKFDLMCSEIKFMDENSKCIGNLVNKCSVIQSMIYISIICLFLIGILLFYNSYLTIQYILFGLTIICLLILIVIVNLLKISPEITSEDIPQCGYKPNENNNIVVDEYKFGISFILICVSFGICIICLIMNILRDKQKKVKKSNKKK